MKKTITAWLFFLSAVWLHAQENDKSIFSFEISNSAELQYNFTDGGQNNPKFVNHVVLESALSTRKWWRNGLFRAGFWSVAESLGHPIVDDMLTFSNIDENTNWLLCALLGYEHTFGRVKVFGGIRAVSLDYFSSPYSSVFTNSSAGLFPTISLNYAVAD